MLGNFVYHNPTKLYFGPDALDSLKQELQQYGPKVQLIYGKGSIKRSGLYDQIVAILQQCGKQVFEDAGVMPNPTVDKLYEGCRIAKQNDVDLLLAVGGGSVCDYAKAVSVSAHCTEDPWDKYYLRMQDVDNKIIPVGCVLTMVGTGSEMNGGAVITDPKTKLKIGHVFGPNVFPKFSIMNPEWTYSLPKYQMVAGIYDIMSHIIEQYFSGDDDNTSDYLAEGLLRSLIHSSRIAVQDTQNYEARSNIMWTATWALNTDEPIPEGSCNLCGSKAGATIRPNRVVINKVEFNRQEEICPNMAAGGVAFYDGVQETPPITEQMRWLDAIENDTDPVVLPEQACVVSEILEAIYTSAKTGEPVYFNR